MTVSEAVFNLGIKVQEFQANVGIDQGPMLKDHIFSFVQRYTAGTGASKVGAVWSGRRTISGATPIDLSGSLTSLVDSTVTVSFPLLMGVFLINYSTTAGETILIGGGSNPITTIWGATGDIQKLGPGGFVNLWNPIDGYAVVAATGDILNFDKAAGTPELGVLLLGRAS